MLIEIHIPRPFTLLLGVLAVSGWVLWWNATATQEPLVGQILPADSSGSTVLPIGGVESEHAIKEMTEAEEKIFFARKTHAVLEKKEELLRYQLRLLEEEQKALGDQVSEAKENEFIQARTNLIKLLQNKELAENQIRDALYQLWDARLQGTQVSIVATGQRASLEWPVEPIYGISAKFRDHSYEKHFGFAHDGLDIPALQGTTILAPADGIIEKAVDNGLGYSYIIIRHAGIATLYGHVSEIGVTEGQSVARGEPIGKTGGRPGTKGAGTITTGPHLHLEVIEDGKRIDPLSVLPPHPEVL